MSEINKITVGSTTYTIGGSGPNEYLKSATVSGNKLTVTKQDNTTVDYEPPLSNYRTSADQDTIDNALDTRIDTIEGKESTWDAKSTVSGVNDGTNWTSININGTSKNITSKYTTCSLAAFSAAGSKAVTVSGVTASSTPVLDVVTSTTASTAATQIEAWSHIYAAVTSANTITFYADAATTAITVGIKGY